jgi:hypothetical protein
MPRELQGPCQVEKMAEIRGKWGLSGVPMENIATKSW